MEKYQAKINQNYKVIEKAIEDYDDLFDIINEAIEKLWPDRCYFEVFILHEILEKHILAKYPGKFKDVKCSIENVTYIRKQKIS